MISPWATASEMALNKAAQLSAILGWSKPVMENEPMRIKNEPFMNGALTCGYDLTKRIVTDPMQGLTIDPRVVGISDDCMSFSHIASRKTFFEGFNWNASQGALGVIYTVAATPTIVSYYIDSGNSTVYSQPTAAAWLSALFEYWRGDIVFTFDVICSKFHRGKLGIGFEPNLSQYSLITGSNVSLNKQFIQVVDIQDTPTFEVRVNWATYRAWLKVTPAPSMYGTTFSPGSTAYSIGFSNGFVYVVPFTQLQSPDDSNVTVLVSMRAENLELNGLTTSNTPVYRLTTESESLNTTNEMTTITLNESTASDEKICFEHFGERIASLRAIGKRYMTTTVVNPTTGGTSGVFGRLNVSLPIVPKAVIPFSTSSAASPHFDLLSYMRYAYLGMRGGLRKRLHWISPITWNGQQGVKISLAAPVATQATGANAILTTTSNSLIEGTVQFFPVTNAGIEVEFPYYSNNLFMYSMSETLDDGGTTNNVETTWFRNYLMDFEFVGVVPTTSYIVEETAFGEDFTMLRFQGAPYYSGGVIF
jgi:hypothetical protein